MIEAKSENKIEYKEDIDKNYKKKQLFGKI